MYDVTNEKNRNAIMTTAATTTAITTKHVQKHTHTSAHIPTGTSEGFEKWATSTLPTKQAHMCKNNTLDVRNAHIYVYTYPVKYSLFSHFQ